MSLPPTVTAGTVLASGGLDPVPAAPITAGPLSGPGTHTVLFLDQLYQLVEDLLQGPAGSWDSVGGEGAGVMLLEQQKGGQG